MGTSIWERETLGRRSLSPGGGVGGRGDQHRALGGPVRLGPAWGVREERSRQQSRGPRLLRSKRFPEASWSQEGLPGGCGQGGGRQAYLANASPPRSSFREERWPCPERNLSGSVRDFLASSESEKKQALSHLVVQGGTSTLETVCRSLKGLKEPSAAPSGAQVPRSEQA